MQIAFRCGIKPAEYWDLTPSEFVLCIKGYNDRMEDEQATRVESAMFNRFALNSKKRRLGFSDFVKKNDGSKETKSVKDMTEKEKEDFKKEYAKMQENVDDLE